MEPCDPRDILRLKRCPQCDYDLRTLPEEHRCPECGFHYDPSMFALYGWGRQERHSLEGWLLIGAWWERLFAVLILLFALAAVGFEVYMIWKTGRPRFGLTFMLLIMGIVQAIRMIPHLRGTQDAQGGPTQLFFTPQGVSMRRGPGDARIIAWKRFRRLRFQKFRIHKVGKNSWHLRLMYPFLSIQWRPIEAFIECTPREAALLRSEIRRRLRAARNGGDEKRSPGFFRAAGRRIGSLLFASHGTNIT